MAKNWKIWNFSSKCPWSTCSILFLFVRFSTFSASNQGPKKSHLRGNYQARFTSRFKVLINLFLIVNQDGLSLRWGDQLNPGLGSFNWKSSDRTLFFWLKCCSTYDDQPFLVNSTMLKLDITKLPRFWSSNRSRQTLIVSEMNKKPKTELFAWQTNTTCCNNIKKDFPRS